MRTGEPGIGQRNRLRIFHDIYPDVEMIRPEPIMVDNDRDAALEQLRRRLAVREGTIEDERLRAAVDECWRRLPKGLPSAAWPRGGRP